MRCYVVWRIKVVPREEGASADRAAVVDLLAQLSKDIGRWTAREYEPLVFCHVLMVSHLTTNK